MRLIDATKADVDFLFNLRNEEVSVRYSRRGKLTKAQIEEDYYHNKYKEAYIAVENEIYIGYVIYSNLNDNNYEISIAIIPEQRGQGLGKKLVEYATKFCIDNFHSNKVIAAIYPLNEASKKIFMSAGYILESNKKSPWIFAFELKKIVFIFDMDGVLVNTIDSLYTIYHDFLKKFGINGTKEEFNVLNGLKIDSIISYLKQKYHFPMSREELLKQYTKNIEPLYYKTFLNKDVEKILSILKDHKLKIALASSSKMEHIQTVLNRFHLSRYFNLIVSGDDVENAKPSPEIYNHIKNRFVDHEYYVIEDSKNGILAALNAGMKAIFFNPGQERIDIKTAYEISAMKDLEWIVTEIEENCKIISITDEIEIEIKEERKQGKVVEFQEEIVNKIWNSEKERNSSLFNGKIVAYLSHSLEGDKLVLRCFATEYKYFLAQQKKKSLKPVSPIAVSGIIIDEFDTILLGKRGNTVSEYRSFYEFMPSGGLTPRMAKGNLYKNQIQKEFEEETGMSAESIKTIEPFCVIFDKKHRVYDIGCKILLEGGIQIDKVRSDEYTDLQRIRISSLNEFISLNKCVPVTRTLAKII